MFVTDTAVIRYATNFPQPLWMRGSEELMMNIVMEVILWALKFCTTVLELISAIKNSRHSGTNRVEQD